MDQPTPLIYQRISDALLDSDSISKSKKNQQQGYSFRGIDDVYNTLHIVLGKHKIFTTSEIIDKDRIEWDTKSGGRMTEYILQIRWKFYTTDGSFVISETVGQAMDSGDKAANKAMSAAHKYAFLQIFAIPTVGDNDTENSSPEPSRRADASPPAQSLSDPASPAQIELMRKVYRSHVITQSQRDDMDKAIAKGMTKQRMTKALDTIQGEIKARKEFEAQQREAAAAEQLKMQGVV
jgi:hypothetical protein